MGFVNNVDLFASNDLLLCYCLIVCVFSFGLLVCLIWFSLLVCFCFIVTCFLLFVLFILIFAFVYLY